MTTKFSFSSSEGFKKLGHRMAILFWRELHIDFDFAAFFLFVCRLSRVGIVFVTFRSHLCNLTCDLTDACQDSYIDGACFGFVIAPVQKNWDGKYGQRNGTGLHCEAGLESV